MKEHIRIFTVAWGPHLVWHEELGKPSLHWDVEALRDEGHEVTWTCYPSMAEMLAREIPAHLAGGCVGFFAVSDMVWALGSLYNLVQAHAHQPHCVAVPHVRIRPEDCPELPTTPRDLVAYVLGLREYALGGRNEAKPENATHLGCSVRLLRPGLARLTHHLPSPFLVRFQPPDVEFWQQHPVSQWDRGWLAMLSDQGRLRIAGSSDLAFGVELTPPEQQRAELLPGQQWSDRVADCVGAPAAARCAQTDFLLTAW